MCSKFRGEFSVADLVKAIAGDVGVPFCYASGCLPSGFIYRCRLQGSLYQGPPEIAPPAVRTRQAQSGFDALARRKSLLARAIAGRRELLLRSWVTFTLQITTILFSVTGQSIM